MRYSHIIGVLVALVFSCTACSSLREEPTVADYPPLESGDFGSMRNVSMCGPIWFGSAPTPEDLDLAARRGVRTIIDLTVPDERGDEDLRPGCHSLEIDYLDAGLPAVDHIGDEAVDLVLSRLGKGESGPILMFCGNGGRCALFVAIYRTVILGVPVEAALVEARHAGMKPGEHEDFVRSQVERLLPQPLSAKAGY